MPMSRENQLVSLFIRALDDGLLKPLCKSTQFLRLSRWQIIRNIKGNHLEPVNSSLYIFRLARPSKDFEEKKSILPISIKAFEMSTNDKKGTPPHLSVWIEGYTTPNEAYAFLMLDSPNSPNRVICWLNVGDIREVYIDMDGQIYKDLLNVLWVSIDKLQAGANGHAGITGLVQEKKLVRKNLRSRLADIANKNANDISRLHIVDA